MKSSVSPIPSTIGGFLVRQKVLEYTLA